MLRSVKKIKKKKDAFKVHLCRVLWNIQQQQSCPLLTHSFYSLYYPNSSTYIYSFCTYKLWVQKPIKETTSGLCSSGNKNKNKSAIMTVAPAKAQLQFSS